MPYKLTPSHACYPFKMIYLIGHGGVGTAIQRNSCTQRHPGTFLRHGDTIITSVKHDKQSQSLADINVCPPKTRVGSRDLFNVLHREMQTSGMLGFIGNYNRNAGYM